MTDVDKEALELARAIVAQDKQETEGVGAYRFSGVQLVAPTQLQLAKALVGMHAKLAKRDEQHAEASRRIAAVEREANDLSDKLEAMKRDTKATSVAQLIALFAAEIEELKTKLAETEMVSAHRWRQLEDIAGVIARGKR
jgi:hypothetical protein